MNYRREWTDLRNAAGFAAACARLALPLYRGDHRSDLLAAIDIAERYTGGEDISYSDATAAADAADPVDVDEAFAAYAAAYAADTVAYTNSDGDNTAIIYVAYGAGGAARAAAAATNDTATSAARAGVDDSEIQIAYARWVTRDLAGDQKLPEELRQAAGAAIVAGDEDLARKLIGSS